MQEQVSLPLEEAYTCRICHEQSYPLLKVCQCLGTISFVHKTCIKKWICYLYRDKKIKTHPRCELCGSPFSVKIIYKQPKVYLLLLLYHLFNFSLRDKTVFLLLVTLLIATVLLNIKIIVILIKIFIYSDWKTNIYEFGTNILLIVIIKLLFPMYFYKPSIKLFSRLRREVLRSRLPVISIKVLPKVILREEQ